MNTGGIRVLRMALILGIFLFGNCGAEPRVEPTDSKSQEAETSAACDWFGILTKSLDLDGKHLPSGQEISVCPPSQGATVNKVEIVVYLDDAAATFIRAVVPIASVAYWENRLSANSEYFAGAWFLDSGHEPASDVFLTIDSSLSVIRKIAAVCEVIEDGLLACGPTYPNTYSFIRGQGRWENGELIIVFNFLVGVGPTLSQASGSRPIDSPTEHRVYRCGTDALCAEDLGILLRVR